MTNPDLPGVLADHLAAMAPQRLILRGVDENRPEPLPDGRGVSVGHVRYVEVCVVVERQLVRTRFDGVTLAHAVEMARRAGHDVVERQGNLT